MGPCGEYHCNGCGRDSEFHGVITYRIRHIYWIFRWVTDTKRYMACGLCGRLHDADHNAFGSEQERAAIPFFDRRGWTIGAGIIGSLFAMGAVASASDNRENQASIHQPHVGDLYEVNVAKMMDKPEQPLMYSAMRVADVHGGDVAVQVGKKYYNLSSGVDRDIREGMTGQPDYYMDGTLTLKGADLQHMLDDGTILDVQR